jgi:hypothetical protein
MGKRTKMTSYDDMRTWAMGQITADFDSVKRQIVEYAAIDLEMMGMGLLEQSSVQVSDDERARVGMEMALIFYLQGKIARCVSAISASKMPSDDTYKDLRVYAFMLAHVREFGHWNINIWEESPDAG